MFVDAYRLLQLLCMFDYLYAQLHDVFVILLQPES